MTLQGVFQVLTCFWDWYRAKAVSWSGISDHSEWIWLLQVRGRVQVGLMVWPKPNLPMKTKEVKWVQSQGSVEAPLEDGGRRGICVISFHTKQRLQRILGFNSLWAARLCWWACVWPGCPSIYYTTARVEELWLPGTLTTVDVGGNVRWTQPCFSDLPVPFKIRKLLWSQATERLFLLFNCHQFISSSSH